MPASPSPRRCAPRAGARVAAPSTPCPRAGVDPIRCGDDALAVFEIARHLPPTAETIAFFLDDRQCGIGAIVQVADTIAPDDVVGVVEVLSVASRRRIEDGTVSGLVVASCRPRDDLRADDEQRWFDLCEVADAVGLTLYEWFVLGPSGPSLPRELAGQPSRWAGR